MASPSVPSQGSERSLAKLARGSGAGLWQLPWQAAHSGTLVDEALEGQLLSRCVSANLPLELADGSRRPLAEQSEHCDVEGRASVSQGLSRAAVVKVKGGGRMTSSGPLYGVDHFYSPRAKAALAARYDDTSVHNERAIARSYGPSLKQSTG